MKKSSIWNRIFSSSKNDSKKTRVFLDKERNWLLAPDDSTPNLIKDDEPEGNDDFLNIQDFTVDYLGIPNQAFYSYEFLDETTELEFSLLEFRLLYKGSKNYIFHILKAAYEQAIADDIIIRVFGKEKQILNTITLKNAKIQSMAAFNQLSKEQNKPATIKVIFYHNKRIVE